MKLKKVLGLALSAMMAISAVVPWTGMTASAEEPEITPYAATWFYFEASEGGDLKVSNSDLFGDDYEIIEAGDSEGLNIWDFLGETTVEALPYDGWEFDHWEVSKFYDSDWVEVNWPQEYSLSWWDEFAIDGIRVVFEKVEEEEPATVTVTVQYVDEEQNPIEGVDSMTFEVPAETDLDAWADEHYDEYVKSIEGYEVLGGGTNGTTIIVKYKKVETPPVVEAETINKVVITVGENLLADLSTDITKGWINIFAYAADDDDKFVLTSNGMAGGAVFSTSSTSKIPEDLTVENFKNYFGTYNITTTLVGIISIKECGPEYVQDIYVAEEGEQNVLYIKLEIEGEEPVEPETKEIGVNYWDIENNKQAGEGKVTVAADANKVNTSALTDIPEGYELATTGDIEINGGWIFVDVRPVATTKEIGVNYWDVENNEQVMEGKVTVAADANNVNMSQLDVPDGYELTGYIGDYQINDGWIFVEVRPIATTKTVGVNYWDVENNVQVSEGTVTVAIDANNVNMSQLDVPDGYELTGYIGDYQINDGWIYVEVKPAEGTRTVGLNYWDVVNNKQVKEGSVVVDEDATYVNTSTFTDIPEGYELVWVGDLQIMDGWVWVEVRPVEGTRTVGLNFWDIENNKQVKEGAVVVDKDATYVNTSAFEDQVPKGYELVWIGDLQINDDWVWVEIRPVEAEEPDDSDDDDSESGSRYPYIPPVRGNSDRDDDDTTIDDDDTPLSPGTGEGTNPGDATPGNPGDATSGDPSDVIGDENVPKVDAPQTGRKIAGSVALLAGAAAVAVVTFKKRRDK